MLHTSVCRKETRVGATFVWGPSPRALWLAVGLFREVLGAGTASQSHPSFLVLKKVVGRMGA